MSVELDVDQSYAIMEWLTTSLNKVAEDPRLLGEFLYEYSNNLEGVIDSVMSIVKPEHRGVVADLLKATARVSTEVLLWTTKK